MTEWVWVNCSQMDPSMKSPVFTGLAISRPHLAILLLLLSQHGPRLVIAEQGVLLSLRLIPHHYAHVRATLP